MPRTFLVGALAATALAGDWRYQLTPIGSFTNAIVGREVDRAGTFVIRTRKPDTKVSWTIIGERIDPYARKNPIVAIQAKKGKDRGRYLNPDAYGQPRLENVRPPIGQALAAARQNPTPPSPRPPRKGRPPGRPSRPPGRPAPAPPNPTRAAPPPPPGRRVPRA